MCNGERAYRYRAARDLLEEDFEKVSTNVDNFVYTLMAWYVKGCEWSTGHAQNEADIQKKELAILNPSEIDDIPLDTDDVAIAPPNLLRLQG
ncbi:hypothetical protein N7512_000405 [Penicillium capsulatum]|nr:hypothetical protein N7512_000405 [Penicillium capsulatum]